MSRGTRPIFIAHEGEAQMPETITLTKEQFDALLSQRTTGAGDLTAEALAKAFSKAQRPENTIAPQISPFNPRGETEHPRPPLRCKTLQNGIEIDHDTLMWEEIEALNALPQGEFKVAKANGSLIPFTVKHTRTLDGDLERVDVHYPCKDEQRYDHRPLLDYCLDVLDLAGLTDEVTRLRALRRELDGLRRKTA